MQAYLDQIPNLTAANGTLKDLVLLTDNQSAIDEADLVHPQFILMYIH